jgi:Ca2+-transporting ATPase
VPPALTVDVRTRQADDVNGVAQRAHQVSAGLSSVEAAGRLRTEGRNEVAPPRPPGLAARILRQFADPLVTLLLICAVVTVVLGDLTDTAVILLVVVVNTAIGVAQEVRADRAITALHQLSAPMARVVRDGVDRMLPAAEVVRGDVLLLSQGDIVPADAVVHRAEQLRLDESALTGESVPVQRDPDQELSAGTVVLTGRATAEVTRTGADSALGRIATLVAGAHAGKTPLQKRLAGLGRVLGLIAVVLSAVVLLLGVLAGEPVAPMAIAAVSLVVAAVPESLPAVVTLALALGAMRMARGNAIARRLHAVETLGSVTVLATDKTGTLTEGRMAVATAVTPDGRHFDVYGQGYSPSGGVRPSDGGVALEALARAAVRCNDASLNPPTVDSREWTAVGDPLEAALLAFAARCGLDIPDERAAAPRMAEEPFDAGTRRMVTAHETVTGMVLVCKGAPEVVLDPLVSHCAEEVREALRDAARELADRGLRVLAIATGHAGSLGAGPLAVRGLIPLGLIGIGDPVRTQAAQTAAELAQAGIRMIVITGDHPATAAAVADQLGVAAGDVFARTTPEQKLDIIAALQASGQVVAMTGDGVNDAPALRRADIGVAMGAGGTEVARQAADLVLADDNIATVTTAVHEGRRIYDNIRRFLRYGLAGGAAEIVVMLLGPFLGLPLPLLPAQILWVNLITHGVPGVALGAEPAEPATMRRAPHPPDESILGRGLVADVLLAGALISGLVLAIATAAHHVGAPWQSMAFMVLGLSQLGVALAVRAPRRRGGPGNRWLWLAVALSALMQLAAVGWGPLRVLLGTSTLSATQLAGCLLASAVPGLVVAARESYRRRRPSEVHSGGRRP